MSTSTMPRRPQSSLLAPLPSSSTSRPFFVPSAKEDHPFHPYSSLSLGAEAGLVAGTAGLVLSAAKNALNKQARSSAGVFTRTGGIIVTFGAMGFTYAFGRAVTANIRETDDPVNGAAGGCAAGFVAGLRRGSLPMALGTCAFLGAAIYTLEANDLSLGGDKPKSWSPEEVDERRSKLWTPVKDKAIPTDLPAGATA